MTDERGGEIKRRLKNSSNEITSIRDLLAEVERLRPYERMDELAEKTLRGHPDALTTPEYGEFLAALAGCLRDLAASNNELEATFNLRHAADMRAIKLWRSHDPKGRELRQPDQADLCCFLMEEIERLRADAKRIDWFEQRGRTGMFWKSPPHNWITSETHQPRAIDSSRATFRECVDGLIGEEDDYRQAMGEEGGDAT